VIESHDQAVPADAVPADATPQPSAFVPSDDSVALTIDVPANAKVFINGRATSSTGNNRRFISRGLQPGYSYAYEVRAELNVAGEPKTYTKVVKLQAGQTADVAFSFNPQEDAEDLVLNDAAGEPLVTTLKVNVPADAKVYLAGHETTSTGEVREFSTTKLDGDKAWKAYPVRVEYQRDGRTLTREQVVTIEAGQSKEVTFDFDAPEVAQAAR
jgi:uncharacterized protein (TIGR03000 family)